MTLKITDFSFSSIIIIERHRRVSGLEGHNSAAGGHMYESVVAYYVKASDIKHNLQEVHQTL